MLARQRSSRRSSFAAIDERLHRATSLRARHEREPARDHGERRIAGRRPEHSAAPAPPARFWMPRRNQACGVARLSTASALRPARRGRTFRRACRARARPSTARTAPGPASGRTWPPAPSPRSRRARPDDQQRHAERVAPVRAQQEVRREREHGHAHHAERRGSSAACRPARRCAGSAPTSMRASVPSRRSSRMLEIPNWTVKKRKKTAMPAA